MKDTSVCDGLSPKICTSRLKIKKKKLQSPKNMLPISANGKNNITQYANCFKLEL